MKFKKILSLVVALSMFLAAIPAFATETIADENTEVVSEIVEETVVSIMMNNVSYDTIQAAVDEATKAAGNYEIILNSGENAETVIIHQTEGVNISIKGNGEDTVFAGYVDVRGHCRYNEAETLTFDKVVFKTQKKDHVFIEQTCKTSTSESAEKCYPHNVTVQNCTFEATGEAENTAVGMKYRYGYNIKVKDTKSTGLHSLMQNYAGVGLEIDGVNITGKSGIALGTSQNVTVKNAVMDVVAYGLRIDAGNLTEAVIEDCNIKAFIPVVVRNVTESTPEYTVIFNGKNTMTETNSDGVWCAIGNTEYKDGIDVPTEITNIKVTLNDEGLEKSGVVGEYMVPPTGSNSHAYTKEVDGYVRVWGEAKNCNASESFVLKLYSEDTLIATTTLNNIGGIIDGDIDIITWNFFYPESKDPYWTTVWEEGHPNSLAQPTKVELIIDGTVVDTTSAKMSGADDLNLVKWEELGGVKSPIYIGETGYDSLDEAVKAAEDSDIITIIADGTYKLPSFGKDITIKAADGVKNVIFDDIGALNLSGSNVTFENITFDYYPNVNYTGLQHSGNLTYNNCTINGQVFLYGTSETFNDCTFNQNSSDAYNVWTYSAKKVDFNNCIFNSAGKSVLVYNEGATGTALSVAGTTFNASQVVEGKAAIEVDSSLLSSDEGEAHSIAVTESTATGFASGSVSGNSLWNNKKGELAEVTVDGEKVLSMPVTGLKGSGTEEEPYLINNLEELKWFRDDVNAGNTYSKKVVKLVSDINLENKEWTPISVFNGTFDGQNHTISNLVVNGGTKSNQGFFGQTNDGEIKNVTFNNAKVSGRLNVGVVAGTPYTSKYTNINITGHVEVDGMSYVGGMGGKNAYANITDVTINVDDTSYVKANSVENGTAYRTYVGGVIGFMGEGGHTVSNVTSNINVIGSTCDIGGIVGIAHYGNKFINVKCTGDVACEAAGETEVGGIAGTWHNQDGKTVTAIDCLYDGIINVADEVVLSLPFGTAYNATGTGTLDATLKEAVAAVGVNKYSTLAEAVKEAKAGDTIIIYPGTYTEGLSAKSGVSVVGMGEVKLGGKLSVSGDNVYVKNINVEASGDAFSISGNGTVEDCNFKGNNGARYCYANNGDVTFKNCVITGNTYGVHFDAGSGEGDVILDGCSVTGWTSFGTAIENVSIKNTTFEKGNYNQLRFYQNAIVENCSFNPEMSIDFGKNETTSDFTNCSVTDGSELLDIIYVADIVNMGIAVTIDDVSVAVVASVGEGDNVKYYTSLQKALDEAVALKGEVTVEILDNIDLAGVDWNPVTVSAPNYPKVTVNGNNKVITNLNDMLFAGTWAGGSGLIINDLTIKDSKIENDVDDKAGNVGVGAFIGYPQASAVVTLNNCHLVDSTVSGGHWTGGLVGMSGGYNGNDGPVFMTLTIKDCSVTGSTITGKGSVGGVIGHGACNAWTEVNIVNTTVSGNTITSTGDSNVKAGSICGTVGAAGTATTTNGITHTGGVNVSATVKDNTVTSNGTEITTIYGRKGSEGGVITLTGGAYDGMPIGASDDFAKIAPGCALEYEYPYFVVVEADVAKIGNATFKSLQAAIDSAKAGDTITLITDVALQDGLNISADDIITIDLAGKTVSQTKKQTNGYQMILNDGNLTIEDSVGGGKISYTDSGNGGEYISDTIYNRGVLTVNGGTIENLSSDTVATNGYPHAIDTYSGIRDTSVTINDGTIYCESYSAIRMFCVSAKYKNDLNINRGTIKGAIDFQNGTSTSSLGSLNITDGTFETTANENNIRIANWAATGTGDLFTASVTGGTFNGGIYTKNVDKFDSKFITGGTFKSSSVVNYLAPGYTIEYDSVNKIFAVKQAKVAAIGSAKYTSLQDAVNEGGEITLLADVTENITIPDDANIVLDLNDKTLTGYIAPCNPKSLTVKNGSIKNPDYSYSAIEINAGELVLDDVNIESERHAVRIDGAVMATINSGTYKILANYEVTAHAVNVSGAATVTINGGTFYGPMDTPNGSAMGGTALNVRDNAVVTINGGTFSDGVRNTINGAQATNIVVKAGIFDEDVSKYTPFGYTAVTNDNSVWTIQEVKVTLENNTVSTTGAKKGNLLVLASYTEEGRMIDIKYISLEENVTEKTVSEFNLNTENANTVKAFMIKDFVTMSPLCAAAVATN